MVRSAMRAVGVECGVAEGGGRAAVHDTANKQTQRRSRCIPL
jgi:hypothetical protein